MFYCFILLLTAQVNIAVNVPQQHICGT